MKETNFVNFSGGKDSTALVLWAKENLDNVKYIFSDTSWEAPETYEYVDMINKTVLGGHLFYVKSNVYKGFEDLVLKQNRFPVHQMRACTNELKIQPTKKFLDQFKGSKVNIVGVRAGESDKRALLSEREFSDYFGCDIWRPLLKWTTEEVFNYIKYHGVPVNPLYKKGFLRVGCMPCIMCGLKEIIQVKKQFPDRLEVIEKLEKKVNDTFFSHHTIPERYRTKILKSGLTSGSVEDVLKYLNQRINQESLFEEQERECFSNYNLCE